MANFYLFSEFLPEICWEEIAEKILFVFYFDVWPGVRTLALCLISQHTTYYGDFQQDIHNSLKYQSFSIVYTMLARVLEWFGFEYKIVCIAYPWDPAFGYWFKIFWIWNFIIKIYSMFSFILLPHRYSSDSVLLSLALGPWNFIGKNVHW